MEIQVRFVASFQEIKSDIVFWKYPSDNLFQQCLKNCRQINQMCRREFRQLEAWIVDHHHWNVFNLQWDWWWKGNQWWWEYCDGKKMKNILLQTSQKGRQSWTNREIREKWWTERERNEIKEYTAEERVVKHPKSKEYRFYTWRYAGLSDLVRRMRDCVDFST